MGDPSHHLGARSLLKVGHDIDATVVGNEATTASLSVVGYSYGAGRCVERRSTRHF